MVDAWVTFALPIEGPKSGTSLFRIGSPTARVLKVGIMKTISTKEENVRRSWYLVDATDKTLGRLSTQIANRIRGKHKPEYTPNVDTGDYVVVVNADKVRVSNVVDEVAQ